MEYSSKFIGKYVRCTHLCLLAEVQFHPGGENTEALKFKAAVSVVIVAAICIISPMIGLTEASVDEKEGVMIDFGYYNVKWIESELSDGENGVQALEEACASAGISVVKDIYGDIQSVDGESSFISTSWSMYVLSGEGSSKTWKKVASPSEYDVGKEKIISWTRVSGESSMMPAVDSTGYTYYSYAENGKTIRGEDLRVVTMAPSVTETVAAVGGLDLIIATDTYSNYPEELNERSDSISKVGGYTDPNYELIVGVSPDIVFLDGSVGEHVNMADKLRKSGINVVVLYEVIEVSDLYKNIWIAASALGFSEKGNTYNEQLSNTIDSVCAVTDIQSCKAFISLSTSDSPYVAGSGTYANSILTSVGATNIFSNISSWGMVDREAIYVKQPDAIIIIYEGGEITTDQEYEEALRSLNSMWKDTPAFENKNIYIFSGKAADLLSRPGARLGAAAELIAKVLDPDAFIAADYWDRCPKYFGDDYADYLKYQGTEGVLLV